jgi:hypothetical protein
MKVFPTWVLHAAYHGLRGLMVAMATGITALGHWPTRFEWMVVVCGGVLGFYSGADSYRTEPH